MKLAIIVLVMWYLVLQFWVKTAEHKSKTFDEEREKERMRKIREREEWVKRYRK